MKNKYFIPIEKLSKYIRLYVEMGQSIAVLDPIDPKNDEAVYTIEKELLSSHDSICVDFKKVTSPCSLAGDIIVQCRKLVSRYRDMGIEIMDPDYSNDYHCLDDALEKPQKIARHLGEKRSILFYCRNLTYLLSLNTGKQIQEHMRAVMQHQSNVILISRGGNKEENNALFLDPHAPFFRYVEIIQV